MRIKGSTVQQYILGLALLAALCWNLAHANEINDLKLSDGATGTRAELFLQSGVAFRTLRLSNPDRFVVDLPDTTAGRNLRLPTPAGVVKGVRSGQPVPGTTRIVFDLSSAVVPLKPHLESGAGGVRLVLEWPGDGPKPVPNAVVVVPNPVAPAVAVATPVVDKAAADTPAHDKAAVSADKPFAAAEAQPVTGAPKSADPAQAKTVMPSETSQAVSKTAASKPVAAQLQLAPMQLAPIQLAPLQPAPPTASPMDALAATVAKSSATPNLPPAVPIESGKRLQDLRTGTRPLIVAIDPGHGGQDPGALGPSGKREKDVTLAIARELARQVNATPGLKAYLTRDADVFLPLPQRTRLARQAKADILISIHADAAENRSAKGSSVYVLSLRGASSQRARWLANKENSADLIGGTRMRQADNTLASVLLDLTQSGQMKASEDAADNVLSGLKSIGHNHKPNIERANFAVLRTSDMPAMLVETAFISNPDEEKRLNDPAYQRQLARAVLDGVDTYFTRQPPPGTLYAARAKALEGGTVVASAAPPTAKSVTTGGSP